ncbi:MAG: hypothetical protein SF162_09765 [bacterium]|nr:hypothetical protein [bacterium]
MNARTRHLRSLLAIMTASMTLLAVGMTLLAILFTADALAAQGQGPDYAIRNIRTERNPDSADVSVVFDVVNNGGPATATATARVIDNTGTELGTPVTVQPLGAAQTTPVRITFPIYLFTNRAGQIVSLTAQVGLNEIERENSESAGDNTARISLPIPPLEALVPPSESTPAPIDGAAQAAPGGVEGFIQQVLNGDVIDVAGIDVNARVIVIGLLIGLFVLLILIWVVTIILRLLFTRPAVFPAWQPPYATAAYLDPNSLAGRRSLWQPHAQSDSLPMPCQPGSYAARKVLVGIDSVKLHDWRITGVRLNQYDMYGRVARSQVIGDTRLVKRLDRLAKRSASLDKARAERAVRRISGVLTRHFRRRLNKRSAMLPLALDVRFQGRHGEVRIAFELQQCVGDGYVPVDSWEPEMVVTTNGGVIQENFTYTLYGQRQAEKTSAFIKRLRIDINRTLAQMIAGAAPAAGKPAPGRKAAPPPGSAPSSVPPAPAAPPAIMGGETEQVQAQLDPTPTPGGTQVQQRNP